MTDAQLLARFVRARDQAAFAEIVSRHAGLVVGAARRLAPLDADDVAQATFFLLAQRAARLTHRTSLAGWLYVTAQQCARNARRSRRRQDRKLAAQAARGFARTVASAPTTDVAALLDDALARLPSAVRDVVLLRHVESLSVAETAERVGVAATTVTKRSERGLSRLRDFFAARGHATLGVAGVTTLLAAPTAHVDAATLASAATGKASPSIAALAATPAVPMTAIAAAALAIVAAAAATLALRPGAPSSAVAATKPTPAAPTTQPPAALTQEGAKAVATAFLDAIRAGDRTKIATFWENPGETERDASTTAILEAVRPYAAFPKRLALGGSGWFQQEPTVFNADGTTRPTSPGGPRLIGATLEAQTPTEADIGRLVLTLNVVGDAWKIGTAEFVADGAVYAGSRVDVAAANAALPVPADVARRALAAWSRAEAANAGVNFDDPTPQDVTKLRAAMVAFDSGVAEYIETLSGTSLAIPPTEAAHVRAALAKAITILQEPPTADLKSRLAAIERDVETGRSFARIYETSRKLNEVLDAADEANPSMPRPAATGTGVPVRIAWWKDEVVRLRGPVAFPEWIRSTRAWKRWEVQHDIKTFRTRDDAGNFYEVSVAGASRTSPDAKAEMNLEWIRRYRPDGTLAAIVEFIGRHPYRWGEFDETGRRYRYRVSADVRDPGAATRPIEQTPIAEVKFFAADGAIRYWYTSHDAENRVWWERVQDPIGEHEQTTHLVHKDGRDDGKPEDDLPIEGLPVERE